MSSTCKEIRQAAWNILKSENTFWIILGAWVVLQLLGFFVSIVLNAALTGSIRLDASTSEPMPVKMVNFVFSSVFAWGFISMILAAIRGEKDIFAVAFSGFSCPFRAIGYNLALTLIVLLWFLPVALLAGGLCLAVLSYVGGWAAYATIGVCAILFLAYALFVSYRYALAWYVKIEEPELGAFAAISKSAKLIHGFKLRLFKLHLSYLIVIWTVLIPLVGIVFFIAYVSLGTAIFYRQVAYAREQDIHQS